MSKIWAAHWCRCDNQNFIELFCVACFPFYARWELWE